MQPKLHHSAANNASTEHQCTSNQARPFDDVAVSAKVTNVKIEGLTDCLTSESDVAQLKKIKSCIDMPKVQNRNVALLVLCCKLPVVLYLTKCRLISHMW